MKINKINIYSHFPILYVRVLEGYMHHVPTFHTFTHIRVHVCVCVVWLRMLITKKSPNQVRAAMIGQLELSSGQINGSYIHS